MLRKQGFTVDTAENGKVGLQMMIERRYNCVFCDLTMPEMDGFETLKEFREWEVQNTACRRQYICALSANTDEGSQLKAKECGFDNFLPKPSKLKVLLQEIEKAQQTADGNL